MDHKAKDTLGVLFGRPRNSAPHITAHVDPNLLLEAAGTDCQTVRKALEVVKVFFYYFFLLSVHFVH